MPLSREGRLLCASTQAYAIKAPGRVPDTLPPPNPPRSQLVGYTTWPTGFDNGLALIDAGFVGEAEDAIIVAFRGTLALSTQDFGQSILDWADNADAPLVNGANIPGAVHQGFLGALDVLWPSMQPMIAAAVAASPGKPIWCTGHSKGGALANLAAARIAATMPRAPIVVRTFAAARCGDQDFADGYAATVANSLRYEYADDIVPHLPPMGALAAELAHIPFIGAQLAGMTPGYVSVGTLQYIPNRAAPGAPPLPDSPALETQRIQSLTALLLGFQFETIVNDHSIDPTSGYADAICPGF